MGELFPAGERERADTEEEAEDFISVFQEARWPTAGRSVRENTGSPSTSSVTIIDQVRSIKSTSACILHCVCNSVVSLVEILTRSDLIEGF